MRILCLCQYGSESRPAEEIAHALGEAGHAVTVVRSGPAWGTRAAWAALSDRYDLLLATGAPEAAPALRAAARRLRGKPVLIGPTLRADEAVSAVASFIRRRGLEAALRAPLKRLFDVVASAAALVLLAPLLAGVALAVRIGLGSPVLFRQMRPGLGGHPFEILKFRTMKDAFGADGTPLPDAERLTPLGELLRASSLDELPELWNVLRGDMSLVGPRPLLMQYLPLYSDTQKRRHEVRPGITGWAQVNGRNAISWDEKFRYDVWYVDHVSLWLDLRIMALTVLKVFARQGISSADHATMPEFTGSSDLADKPGDRRSDALEARKSRRSMA